MFAETKQGPAARCSNGAHGAHRLLRPVVYSCDKSAGKVPMRSSAALVAVAHPAEVPDPVQDRGVNEVLRTLTGLIDILSRGRQPSGSSGTTAEEVLVDTEVDGARYLLVRMRRPGYNRIQLSPREQEIVRMVAKGHPNKVIADVLNISSWTVCTHLRRIFAKLGVGSRAAMVAQLLEMGVLGSEHRIALDARSAFSHDS